MEKYSHILEHLSAGVRTVTINRPEMHNAFNEQTISELTKVFKDILSSTDTQLLVLRGAGFNFCAGGDLNWMKKSASYTYEQNLTDARALSEMLTSLVNLQIPTIAVVQGAAVGGGFGLAACCDIIIASEDAFFQLSEVRLGLAPAVISPYIVKAIGARATTAYALTAEKISAQQALNLGLVHVICNREQLDAVTTNYCVKILLASPEARKVTKSLLKQIASEEPPGEIKELTVKTIAQLRVSPEGQEGIKSFLDKRNPNWISPETSAKKRPKD